MYPDIIQFVHIINAIRKASHGEYVELAICDNIVEVKIHGSEDKAYAASIDLDKLPGIESGRSKSESLVNALVLLSMKAEIALHPTAHPAPKGVH